MIRATRHHTPALAAALAATLTDASSAATTVLRAHGRLSSAALAFACAASLAFPPVAAIAVAASAIARRREIRAGLRALRAGIGRAREGGGSLDLVLLSAAIGYAAVVSAILGRHLIGAVSAHLASTALVLLAFGAMALALPIAALGTRVLAPRLQAAGRRVPPLRALTRGLGLRVVLGAIAAAALVTLLPEECAPVILASIAAWALGAARVVRAEASRLTRAGGGVALAAASLVAMLACTAVFPHLPGRAQLAVLHRPGFGPLLIAGARRVVDLDRDGYSPILGGGDCDDRDPHIHAGATDVPGNGIDENCSGADAEPYAPTASPLAIPAPRSERPRNIVLVHVDALRPDHLHFAGYPRSTSPEMDRFRASASWFRRAYTPAPSTRYAMASLFTGLDIDRIPQRRGPGNDFTVLPAADTVAERLEPLGYDRVGLTLGYVIQHVPGVGQGFRVWKTPWPIERETELHGHDAALTSDAALGYLASFGEDGGRPFFLYAHYECVHAPYVKHDRWDFGDSDVDRYDSAIAYCDAEVGRLLRAIDQRDDRTRAVVVLFSDHGELLGEQGLATHGTSLLEPAVRSLLLVRVPDLEARTIDAPVTLIDLTPTLLSLASAGTASPVARTDGWSLLGLMASAEPDAREASERTKRRPVFLYVDDWRGDVHYQSRGVVDGSFKYVRDVETGVDALFDEEADPTESVNLKRRLPRVRGQLARLLEAWGAATAQP